MIPQERLMPAYREVLVEVLKPLSDNERMKVLIAIVLDSKSKGGEIYSRQAPWMNVEVMKESFRYYLRGWVGYVVTNG